MKPWLKFALWPSVCGLLLAYIVLDHLGNSLLPHKRTATKTSFANAVALAVPSVVNIYTTQRVIQTHPWAKDPVLRRYLGRNAQREEKALRSLGSGVIMSNTGYILSNYHVIAGAEEILVLLHDGREFLATLIGADPDTDLAVLKINAKNLKAIALGVPKAARVGDVVLAIGNPHGLGHSVSQGIISATGRYVGFSTYENFIQTDAAINRGNSGGALVDTQGQLLGINTAIFTDQNASSGIALATPIDLAVAIMDDIVNYGEVIRGWLGLEINTVFSRESATGGLRISTTHLDGPADRAGLRQGDIITHIDGSVVNDGRSTMNQIAMMRPGEKIAVDILRGETPINVIVELGRRPRAPTVER